jgi:8-oxo-dGTP pyrophosphatase MutT (NUDIX family)
MVQRPARGYFGGLMVFPGGAVDPVDRGPLAAAVVTGSGPDHEFRSAALREAAEEIGIAFTIEGITTAPSARGESLFEALQRDGIHLDGAGLVLISRWVTPTSAPVRFDTRFFVTRVDGDPKLRLDSDELVGHRWALPEAVLAAHEIGELELILPTIAHLRWLARRGSVDEIVASAKGADGRTVIEPSLMEDGSLVPIHMPADR